MINYCGLKENDIANGEGVRVSLFVSGCTNHCKGCFQKETWDFNYGSPFTQEVQDYIITLLKRDYIKGLTLLGGDPMEPKNQKGLVEFLKRVKSLSPYKDVWCYTGFVLEDLLKEGTYCNTEVTKEMLSYIDVLVDGKFEEDKKDITLAFRGSSNQRIINLKEYI